MEPFLADFKATKMLSVTNSVMNKLFCYQFSSDRVVCLLILSETNSISHSHTNKCIQPFFFFFEQILVLFILAGLAMNELNHFKFFGWCSAPLEKKFWKCKKFFTISIDFFGVLNFFYKSWPKGEKTSSMIWKVLFIWFSGDEFCTNWKKDESLFQEDSIKIPTKLECLNVSIFWPVQEITVGSWNCLINTSTFWSVSASVPYYL